MSDVSQAPLAIERVTLVVNDLDKVSEYYQQMVGLELLKGDGTEHWLGAGDRTLLHLREDRAARRWSPREAGLFHTAFLLPNRADLGAWAQRAVDQRIAVSGASDHLVSEAIYLQDPEGNGIEIYTDRPRSSWHWKDGLVEMTTEALDLEGLLASATGEWRGAPIGTIVGHVHLQVGEIAAAEDFYIQRMGFDLTCRYPGGSFFSTGGYHHHIATNVWNSRGAPSRTQPSTGLSEIVLAATPAALERLAPKQTLLDPWGNEIALVTNSR
ncbi:VOC family protein [Halotalea alkalilenta]|uniref:Glyoxalase n=1 Tax=Halotalea alkalilenta TaxID=376489 RepID=A0A172YDH2_9GAMM|nr:VOC family protein [Halotalea alkalilenta]ANF57288.1 glyoxalase [Halotalea alkalilenta]